MLSESNEPKGIPLVFSLNGLHPLLVQWFSYILQCSDDSFYGGHTENIQNRLAVHNAGQGAEHTRNRRPVRLVYSEGHASKADAIAREKQIKKWSRAKKLALIKGDEGKLHELSMRRGT